MSLADNTDLNCLSPPPTSPLYERPMSDVRSTPFSKRSSAIRHARSTAHYSAYKLPSREQRQAFSRKSRRKKMFADGLDDVFIPPTKPRTIHTTADPALPSVHVEVAAPHVEEHLAAMPYDTHLATQQSDLTIKIPSAVDRLGLQLLNSCIVSEQTEEDENIVDCATPKSGLTIKIPGLVDSLALRFLGSCNLYEKTQEGEDVDHSSLDGSTASDSSSSDDGDINDDRTYSSYSSSPTPAAGGPDRAPRHKHRRIAAPYHRAVGKPKRKELWIDTDISAGSEVPAFLLGSPTCSSSAF